MFQIDREKCSIVEMKARETILTVVNGSGQKRRAVELFVTVDMPLSKSLVVSCRSLVPNLKEQLDAVASKVEDGGGGLVIQAKTKIAPMTLDLRPETPDSAPAFFHWTVAESKGAPSFRIDKKGDGIARFRWKVRATKGDLEKIPDWLGSDCTLSAAQSQVTLEELDKRRAEEGKAPAANPFSRTPKGAAGKRKGKGAQEPLGLLGPAGSTSTDGDRVDLEGRDA